MGTRRFDCGLVVLFVATAAVAQGGDRRGSVSGIVVDALHEPLAAVEVLITTTDDEVLGKAISDGSGAFLVPRLPVGVAYLQARATAPSRSLGMTTFQLLPDRPNVYGTVVRLYDAGEVTGHVVDAQGRPLVGTHVEAIHKSSALGGSRCHQLTDPDGRFVMTNVPLGDLTVHAFRPGYALEEQHIRLRDQADIELRLVAEPDQVRHRVRVLGAAPKDLADVRFRVYAQQGEQLPSSIAEGRPDANGEWTLVQITGCKYRDVRVSSSATPIEPPEADVPSDAESTIDFHVVRRAESIVRGRLLGPGGVPLAAQTIVCRALHGGVRNLTTSEADGSFEVVSPVASGRVCWLYLIDSRYVVDQEAEADGSVQALVRSSVTQRMWGTHQFTVSPDQTVELHAVRAARIRGAVVDANGPVRGAEVTVYGEDPTAMPPVRSIWSMSADTNGHFAFDRARAVDGQFWVEVSGHAGVGKSERFSVEAGRDVELEVRARPAGIVEGTVVGSDGQVLPGTAVHLQAWNLQTGSRGHGPQVVVLTDRRGRYRHVGVQAGGYVLRVMQGTKEALATDPFECKQGDKLQQVLTLR